jgi:hypothetical protein
MPSKLQHHADQLLIKHSNSFHHCTHALHFLDFYRHSGRFLLEAAYNDEPYLAQSTV